MPTGTMLTQRNPQSRATPIKYSKEARKSDELVQHMISIFAVFVERWGVAWVMENPVGTLQHRPFVKKMRLRHRLHLVDYCAFLGHYKKPTHLWTNIEWTPWGTTGNGRCRGSCSQGFKGPKGRWVHRYQIAQSSQQAAGGVGRRAMKEGVPLMLHEELLQNYKTTI